MSTVLGPPESDGRKSQQL